MNVPTTTTEAKNIKVKISGHAEGNVELIKMHCLHTTSSNSIANFTATSATITNAMNVNSMKMKLIGIVEGNAGLPQNTLCSCCLSKGRNSSISETALEY